MKRSPGDHGWSMSTAPPKMWNTWPVIPCAASAQRATTTGEFFPGSRGSLPPSDGGSSNALSVMRVRAFGAMQLTVTPYRPSSWAATIVNAAMPAFAVE